MALLNRLNQARKIRHKLTTQGKQTTQVMKTGENLMKKNLAQKFKDLGGQFG